MKNYQIIKYFANHDDSSRVWKPLKRYFILLNNYMEGKPLSLVEKINHQQNPPRKCYLEKLAKGFDMSIDFDSPLFEGRINKDLGEIFFDGNSFAIPRFFRRLEEAKEAKIELSNKVVYDLMMMGESLLVKEYPELISLDP